MVNEDRIQQFWRDGYLVIDDGFDAEATAPVDAAIRGHFSNDTEFFHTEEFLTEAKTEVIPWFPQQDGPSAFDKLEVDATLNALTTDILGAGWRSDYCMVMYSKQGTKGQAWHQDCPPDDPGNFNLNRLVYTTDISASTGGQTVVVPGSHRAGILPTGDPAGHFDNEVVLNPRRGTLVLLHGHCWHRVLPIAGEFRYSTNYRAVPKAAPADLTDVCIYRNMRYQFSTSSVVEERV